MVDSLYIRKYRIYVANTNEYTVQTYSRAYYSYYNQGIKQKRTVDLPRGFDHILRWFIPCLGVYMP